MKIVVLDGKSVNPGDLSWEPIARHGELIVYPKTPPTLIVERAAAAEILLTNKAVLDAAALARLPNLKFITVTATGYNVVDVIAARQRGIPVSNVPEYSTQAVAQHVMAMILSWIHQPQSHDQAIREGQWQLHDDFCFWLRPLWELAGQKIGIIGFGRIGQAVASLAVAFGMHVLAFNPRKKDVAGMPDLEWADIDAVVRNSDFVSLHCPLNTETEKMVDFRFLQKMKPSAILINSSRGGLVDEHDLADALDRDRIRAALLDVVSAEPITADNPLLTAKNCLITPHIGWATVESRSRLISVVEENVRAYLDGAPINVVN
jgi:glycerate dehydrogenase